jgi:hypothetical protein
MAKFHTFTAIIHPGRGGGAYVEVPFDVEATFGSKTPAVNAVIEGHPYPTRLMRMGQPCHIIGVPKEIRVKTGKNYGDTITIRVETDLTPRVIETPADLAAAFRKAKAAQAFFDKLSYTHRKEYVRWIEEAKKPETRATRVAKTVEMLLAGVKGR